MMTGFQYHQHQDVLEALEALEALVDQEDPDEKRIPIISTVQIKL